MFDVIVEISVNLGGNFKGTRIQDFSHRIFR